VHCLVKRQHPGFSVKHVVTEALKFRKPASSKEQILQICEAHLDASVAQELMSHIEKYALGCRYKSPADPELSATVAAQEPAIESPAASGEDKHQVDNILKDVGNCDLLAGAPELASVKRTGRGGSNDLVGRRELKKMKSMPDRLAAMLEIEKEVPESHSELTEGARNFVLTVMGPVLSCLRNHYEMKQDEFLAHWGAFSVSTFRKKCCTGKDSSCNNKS
jgi:hypothetical protein